ncbi:MAG TPA: DUF4105 domain-containing protein [Planctomycetota bacterium]|nr:DUF4105 domain-containing protein [Planctomycetota bacterium]
MTLRSVAGVVVRVLGLIVALPPLLLWAPAALWFDGPASRGLAGALAAVWVVLVIVILVRVRPPRRAALVLAALFALLLAWWFSIPPRNDRNWQPDVARPAHVEVQGSQVTIQNVRDFEYPPGAPPVERWETRRYDLEQLVGVDMFLSYWGPTLICHTITSWEFADGQHLAISIETRKEVGEEYSAIRGFFRQFEVYYVVADERDVIGVRAGERGETEYLYRLRVPLDKARDLLLDYLREVDRLDHAPQWYNALTHNCTTNIRWHARDVGAERPFDWRLVVNGYLDELGYERGQLDTSLPFAELRARSNVTDEARSALGADDFSARIREGLPPRPK